MGNPSGAWPPTTGGRATGTVHAATMQDKAIATMSGHRNANHLPPRFRIVQNSGPTSRSSLSTIARNITMAQKKVIAVVGATGAQGGGLVRAILADPNGSFAARAITRKPDSENARALAALGAEVVVGDAD